MRASSGRFGEVLGWSRPVVQIAVTTTCFVAQIAAAAILFSVFVASVPLLFAGLAWLHMDALFGRRLPWLSWPAIVVLDTGIGWVLVLSTLNEMRLRRELPAKVRSRALRCPLCEGPVPAWDGAFERCPPPAPFPHWGDWGPPEGCFRVGCDCCGQNILFAAWLDGTVRAHPGWLFEHKYKQIL